ncbi:MAG: hypothetical protein R6X16_09765 [Anaerolineae bacterium]
MRKSCLVALVLLAAVLLAISVSLRRCYLATTGDADRADVTLSVSTKPDPEAATHATLDATLLSLDGAGTAGLDGLALESLRPLTTEPLTIYGLAASADMLYFAGCDGSGACGQVFALDASTFAPEGQIRVAVDGYPLPGGIQIRGDELWVWQLGGNEADMTLVVVLDRGSLQERVRLTLPGAARSLIVMPDGTLRGTSGDGDWFYRWASDGGAVSRQANTAGATYSDCELLSGSMACAGILEDGAGVLDVLDPTEFSLLARHMANARTEGGDQVVGGAWAHSLGRFMFVPQRGELPILWTYALDGISLQHYIPSLEP